MISPTLSLAMRDLRTLARRDPAAAYDAVAELVELLTAPSVEPYAKPARNLGLSLQRAIEDYARAADDVAERLAEAEREPRLPFVEAA